MREIDCCWSFAKPNCSLLSKSSQATAVVFILVNIHVHIVTIRLSFVYTRIEVVIAYHIVYFNRRAFVGLNASSNSSQATAIVYILVTNIHVDVTALLIFVYTRTKVVLAHHIVYFTRWACHTRHPSRHKQQPSCIYQTLLSTFTSSQFG